MKSFSILKKIFAAELYMPIEAKISNSFQVSYDKKEHEDPQADPFLISTIQGFLPRKDPILQIPAKYEVLDSLLNRMRWNQPDGSPGLLAKKQLGNAIKNELDILDVENIPDKMTELAIFRDYSYLASAYLLEECHHNYLQSGNSYGLGRDHLPENISIPFVKLSQKLDLRPFLEYNSGYALNNWYRKNLSEGINIGNLEIFRSFINIKSEAGFILVHVAINQHSGMLIKIGMDVLRAAEARDRILFNSALREWRDIMNFINQEFERMYYESNPDDYNIFRTFILGISNQPMFPNGVIYEGCFENKPQFYRGESGANDSIIPFCDNILQITQFLPHNPLTEILKDFRSYRPKQHRDFLEWTERAAKKIGILEYARENSESMVLLLDVADQIRAFRHRHWILTNLYIIRRSKHPVATGGSPIITWLPNQLLTVIDYIKDNSKYALNEDLPSNLQYNFDAILKRALSDERIIKTQVETQRKSFK